MTALLTENLSLIAASVNGVKKLRELILQLALMGRFVPQDSKDEPASELLKRAKARNRVSGKRLRQDFQEIGENEHKHFLPQGWEICRFGQVAVVKSELVSPDLYPHHQQVAPDSIEKGTGKLIERRTVRESGIVSPNHRFYPGQILYSKIRPSLSKAALVDFEGLCSADMYPLETDLVPEFALLQILSPLFLQQVKVAENRVKMPKLNQDSLLAFVVLVPPLAEQYRIVGKVKELMGLCDRLESQQTNAETLHTLLVKTLLNALVEATDPDNFRASWNLVKENFDVLFTTEGSIDALKQCIVQLAVMGKLVTQDAESEPEERAQSMVVKGIGKIATGKRAKVNTAQLEVVPPYHVPRGWSWIRLRELVAFSEAGWSPSCENRPKSAEEWGVLKVSAVSWGKFLPAENKALPADLPPRKEAEVQKGDFLISRANTAELVARSVVVDDVPPRLLMSDKIVRLRLVASVDPHYINLYNSCRFARAYYERVAGGTSSSMKNVSREHILDLILALPPVAEQKRIVAKFYQLMLLCDSLKTGLSKAWREQEGLASALIEQALRPPVLANITSDMEAVLVAT
ncbi:MAG TPA: restriction endonuclease subunit S [Planktothrix sp.]|jgi:type I restriction enzyme S subunit